MAGSDNYNKDAPLVTGAPLRDLLQDPDGDYDRMLTPLIEAGQDADFQDQQVGDFTARLTDKVLAAYPRGYSSSTIGDYLTSEKGAALALDQSVNRPGDLSFTVGKALDNFFADPANKGVSQDPSTWTNQQEDSLTNYYIQERNKTQMWDPQGRADRIMANKNLSADRDSLKNCGGSQ